MRKDPIRLLVHVGVYVVLFIVAFVISAFPFVWVGGPLLGSTCATLGAGIAANWLTMRIYEDRHMVEVGLRWNLLSRMNLLWGLLGGVLAASLVLVPPLVVRAAHFTQVTTDHGSFPYLLALLAIGASGEELCFRGYAFQRLLATLGPAATILPVGIIFAFMHESNPNANWFGLANTAGFGVLFGYAFLRSRDLWLPIGLHFGWNLTLPLFGVNLSGLRMNVTGYEMSWTAGDLWSGGAYGPEASISASLVLLALFYFVWKAPIRRQSSPLTDPPAESAKCEPLPPLPS